MTEDNTVSGWLQGLDADGRLLVDTDFAKAIAAPREMYDFAYQAYSIVWYLAMQRANYDRELAAGYIQEALDNYRRGASLSMGVGGLLNPTFEEKPADADY